MGNTYDEIFQCFLDNCGYVFTEIPKSNEMRYRMIRNGVNIYNQKVALYEQLQGNIQCIDEEEKINIKLNSNELLLLAYVIALVFSENKLCEFTSVYSVFSKEMGFKDYRSQLTARKNIIEMYEKKIDECINSTYISFNLGDN